MLVALETVGFRRTRREMRRRMKINVGTLLFERETGAVRVNRKGKRLTGKTRRRSDLKLWINLDRILIRPKKDG